MHWMNGWDWLWMTVAMSLWIVVLAGAVYLAVRGGTKRGSGGI